MRVSRGDSKTDCYSKTTARCQFNRATDSLGKHFCLSEVCLRRDDTEFLSAIAPDYVACPHKIAQAMADYSRGLFGVLED